MNKPIVAVVGRPNTGKSTFFNRVAGKRLSIVEDKPGVTRDRVQCDAEWCGTEFVLFDTGGLEIKSDDRMWRHIRGQAETAIEIADLVIFFVDGKEGVTSNDFEVADLLRTSSKPIILAVNKLDNNEIENLYDFYQLGIGEPYPISAEQGKGIGDLLDAVVAGLPERSFASKDGSTLNVALVGRPNAGKSSLVNKLLGYERVIVSDISGTTRDAIDTEFEYDGKRYNIIDTAGIRRKRAIDEDVEYYSVMRSFAAIKRADVVLVIMDAAEDVTEQDVRICGLVHEEGKPSVIVMNKWDKIEKDTHTVNAYKKKLDEKLKFMDYYVTAFVSAETGQRVDKLMKLIQEVHAASSRRVTTGLLNDVIHDAIAVNEPPGQGGRRLKIMFATECAVNPPTFVFFVNNAELVHFSYKRYLENVLRRAFDFKGTPIHLIFRNKNEQELLGSK